MDARKTALCREKKRLMRMLGMRYMSAGQQVHEFKASQDQAKVAAQFMSNLGLPAVSTMRWNDPLYLTMLVHAVLECMKVAFHDSIREAKTKLVKMGSGTKTKTFLYSFIDSTYKSGVPGIAVMFSGEDNERTSLLDIVSAIKTARQRQNR